MRKFAIYNYMSRLCQEKYGVKSCEIRLLVNKKWVTDFTL